MREEIRFGRMTVVAYLATPHSPTETPRVVDHMVEITDMSTPHLMRRFDFSFQDESPSAQTPSCMQIDPESLPEGIRNFRTPIQDIRVGKSSSLEVFGGQIPAPPNSDSYL